MFYIRETCIPYHKLFYTSFELTVEVKKLIHPLKITSTLADETRYQIYEFMLKEKKHFSVQDIADQFGIHPNVARLHLTKLSEIDIISADFVKTGKGGRPGRVYRANEEGIALSFPKREDALLLSWLLEMINACGEQALSHGKRIAYDKGLAMMQQSIQTHFGKRTLTFDDKINLLEMNAQLIGYVPEIHDDEEQKTIQFHIYNCPFHNYLTTHAEIVCTLHESFLKGQMDALFPMNELKQTDSMLQKCANCQYVIETPL